MKPTVNQLVKVAPFEEALKLYGDKYDKYHQRFRLEFASLSKASLDWASMEDIPPVKVANISEDYDMCIIELRKPNDPGIHRIWISNDLLSPLTNLRRS